jgi:hypothetical protein
LSKPYVSYKYLRDSAKSALLGAIEVYNKPSLAYREETFAVLLVNAWELLLKAILAKNDENIFYPKKRGEPYRTVSITDATKRCLNTAVLPTDYQTKAAFANLALLIEYRDSTIHFYNQPGFRVVIYSLAQTSVANFNELLEKTMGHGLGSQLPGSLLPIGLEPPCDPIIFLQDVRAGRAKGNPAVSSYMREIGQAVQWLEAEGLDTGHLMTVFEVHLHSAKKIKSADLDVSVSNDGSGTVVIQPRDPNKTHPFLHGGIVDKKLTVDGTTIGSYQFQALTYYFGWKGDPRYHWADSSGAVQRYTSEVIRIIKGLTREELSAALAAYKQHRADNLAKSRADAASIEAIRDADSQDPHSA